MSMYWIIFIGFALLSWLVSSRLQNKFEKYSKIPMPNGMTGKDVAEKMLHDNGIYDVKVIFNTFPQLMLFGIILFASTTLFSFITLPVEINASQRALVWLSNAGITNVYTHDKAEDALRSAAYTYVVAALGSLATLLYYIMIFLGGRSRD